MDNQRQELDRAKARIRALAAKTVDRGCSEAEAMAAAAKVGELLDVYGISMSEVDLREEVCVQRALDLAGPPALAMRWVFPALLRFTECRGWTSGRSGVVLFGLEPDVLMGEWLLATLTAALAGEEAKYRSGADYAARAARGPGKGQAALRSFRHGFAARVRGRLDELAQERKIALEAARKKAEAERAAAADLTPMAAERRAEDGAVVDAGPAGDRGSDANAGGRGAGRMPAGTANSTGTALVLVKERKLDDAMAARGIKLRMVQRRVTIRDSSAYSRGGEAGGRVSLDRPLGAAGGGGPTRALPAARRPAR